MSWGAMLDFYQKYQRRPKNIWEIKKVLQSIWNDLPQDAIDRSIFSFSKRLRGYVSMSQMSNYFLLMLLTNLQIKHAIILGLLCKLYINCERLPEFGKLLLLFLGHSVYRWKTGTRLTYWWSQQREILTVSGYDARRLRERSRQCPPTTMSKVTLRTLPSTVLMRTAKHRHRQYIL